MNLHCKRRWSIAWIGLALLASTAVHAQPARSAITLSPGVLVSGPDQTQIAWAADDQGRVAAIRLEDGAAIWRGPAEGLPLALFDGQLVVLGRPDRTGRLSLILLDPETGAARGGLLGDLPAGVLATPEAQPNRRFEVSADADTGALRIRWSHAEWPLRGAALADGAGEPRRLEGVLEVDFAANRLTAIDAAGMPALRTPDLSGSERLSQLDGTQFRAADDATVQVASAIADESLGTQWRWSLHERNSGLRLGQLSLPHAHAPFLLRGTRLLWRSAPLTLRSSAGDYRELPERLVAQDLANGRELWAFALLDREFRGALPP